MYINVIKCYVSINTPILYMGKQRHRQCVPCIRSGFQNNMNYALFSLHKPSMPQTQLSSQNTCNKPLGGFLNFSPISWHMWEIAD